LEKCKDIAKVLLKQKELSDGQYQVGLDTNSNKYYCGVEGKIEIASAGTGTTADDLPGGNGMTGLGFYDIESCKQPPNTDTCPEKAGFSSIECKRVQLTLPVEQRCNKMPGGTLEKCKDIAKVVLKQKKLSEGKYEVGWATEFNQYYCGVKELTGKGLGFYDIESCTQPPNPNTCRRKAGFRIKACFVKQQLNIQK
jgi:hypothetical protein